MATALTPALWVVSALLALAGAIKLRAPDAAADALAAAGVPASRAAARAAGAAEVAAGCAALAVPGAVTAGAVALAYATFAIFLVALIRGRRAGVDCGCFGARSAEAGAVHLIFDVAACALAALACAAPPHGLAWIATRTPLVAVPLIAAVPAATAAAYLLFTQFPALWRSYAAQAR